MPLTVDNAFHLKIYAASFFQNVLMDQNNPEETRERCEKVLEMISLFQRGFRLSLPEDDLLLEFYTVLLNPRSFNVLSLATWDLEEARFILCASLYDSILEKVAITGSCADVDAALQLAFRELPPQIILRDRSLWREKIGEIERLCISAPVVAFCLVYWIAQCAEYGDYFAQRFEYPVLFDRVSMVSNDLLHGLWKCTPIVVTAILVCFGVFSGLLNSGYLDNTRFVTEFQRDRIAQLPTLFRPAAAGTSQSRPENPHRTPAL